MDKLRIREAIVVEGKYDKIRLESVVDALILETDGFAIFKDQDQLSLLRRLAAERGLLVLTDSDSAGFVIRGYLSGVIPSDQIRHAYIPERKGRERRKSANSKEGLLGVEGMDRDSLLQALRRAGVAVTSEEDRKRQEAQAYLTPARLYEDGLSGRPFSSRLRQELLRDLGLPSRLSVSRMRQVINASVSPERYRSALQRAGARCGARTDK